MANSVLRTLEAFKEDAHVQRAGCALLATLCSSSLGFRPYLSNDVSKDACAAVVRAAMFNKVKAKKSAVGVAVPDIVPDDPSTAPSTTPSSVGPAGRSRTASASSGGGPGEALETLEGEEAIEPAVIAAEVVRGVKSAACMAIAALAGVCPTGATVNPSNQNQLRSVGACDAVAEYLGDCLDEVVVSAKAKANAAASAKGGAVTTTLTGSGTGMVEDEAETATNVVAKLAASEREGAAAACYAVAALCLENSHNQTRLGKIHGLCESVAMAMVTLSDDPHVQRNGCLAVNNLSVAKDNEAKLTRGGACEAVLAALRLHMEDKRVVQEACAAMQNLTWSNAGNRKRFAFLGAKGTLEAVRQANKAIEVPRWTAEAATHLSN